MTSSTRRHVHVALMVFALAWVTACSATATAVPDTTTAQTNTEASLVVEQSGPTDASQFGQGQVDPSPDWYMCDENTLAAATVPVSVVGEHTHQDESYGGIYAHPRYTAGIDGNTVSTCSVYYGEAEEGSKRGADLSVDVTVATPDQIDTAFQTSLFDNDLQIESRFIGETQAVVFFDNQRAAIVFDVPGSAIVVQVTNYLDEYGDSEQQSRAAADIGTEIAGLILHAATTP